MIDLFGRKARAENKLLQAINEGLRVTAFDQRDKIEALETVVTAIRGIMYDQRAEIAVLKTVIAKRKAACRLGQRRSTEAKAKARAIKVAKTIADLPAALALDVAA